MNITIPSISSFTRYDEDYITIHYDDGSSRYVPYKDLRVLDQQTNVKLDLSAPNKAPQLIYYFNCDCCSTQVSSDNLGFHYKYVEYERNICRHCLVNALDKLFGLNHSQKAEQVIFER